MQTKSAARNIFYGGSLFFLFLLIALVAHSHFYITGTSTDESTLSAEVLRGKKVWEHNACIDCHTILGEGAYFAPELGNACNRMDGDDEKFVMSDGKQAIMDWIEAQPTGTPGRRQMPNFNLSKEDLSAVASFLCWTTTIKTKGWPPKESG
ncbi:MAG: cytochrome C [Hyphomicrobiales bacterium]|nr:MAG: cytochrome C [Hyphomicrobiales bacterium]